MNIDEKENVSLSVASIISVPEETVALCVVCGQYASLEKLDVCNVCVAALDEVEDDPFVSAGPTLDHVYSIL